MPPTAEKMNSSSLSRAMFYLTAYSLTGAALMGSSIGLVIYQSRHYSFLYPTSSFSSLFASSPSTSMPGAYSPPAARSRPSPSSSSHQSEHPHTGTPFYNPLHETNIPYSNHTVLTIWIPLVLWTGSLLLSSVLMTFRKWIPKFFSARTGILVSQAMFALFWILLGSLQEVQERVDQLELLSKSSGIGKVNINNNNHNNKYVNSRQSTAPMAISATTSHTATNAPVGSSTVDPASVQRSWAVVWYAAIVLLGWATGLLTTSSAALEKLVQAHYGPPRHGSSSTRAVAESHPTRTKTIEVVELGEAENIKCPSENLSEKDVGSFKFTTGQRVRLGLLVVVLLAGQMRFFQWMMFASSSSLTTSSVISSWFTLFGLCSGVGMMALGVKLLPRL